MFSYMLPSRERIKRCTDCIYMQQSGVLVTRSRVKSGIFGQTAKFGQRACLFHISNIGIKINLTKQTVKILMKRFI